MRTATCIGRIGALAVTLGVGISVAAGPGAAIAEAADTTALILCGTTCPTPDEYVIETVKNHFIAPTHPGPIDYVGVTAPMELGPVTGFFRVLGALLGPPSLWGPNGPGWPDEPWWKISGLFDLTGDQSLAGGVAALETAMDKNANDHQVIYGNSQGAGVANVVKKNLATKYPKGTESPEAPDIDFVLEGDPNLPNGGWMSRFPGLYIPILDLFFNGAAATDTQFDTVEINRQYDGFSDFPLYPLNLVATLNALLGIIYVHMYTLELSLPDEPEKNSPAYQETHGDTSYYFFENPDLPLFGPLRTLGVPEPLIDVVEPFFRVLVELGYDRGIPAWEPTPARLIPMFDPVKLVFDLVGAVGEGIDNALALVGLPPLFAAPKPAIATSHTETEADDNVEAMTTADPSPRKVSLASTPEAAESDPVPQAAPAEVVTASESDPDPVGSVQKEAEPTTDAETTTDTKSAGETEGTTATEDGVEPSDEPTPESSASEALAGGQADGEDQDGHPVTQAEAEGSSPEHPPAESSSAAPSSADDTAGGAADADDGS